MKLNSYDVNSENKLRNPIINFGAHVTENDNPLLYAFKGLTGGYASFYSQNDFYAQQFNYSSNQLRDIWEYELNFDLNDVILKR